MTMRNMNNCVLISFIFILCHINHVFAQQNNSEKNSQMIEQLVDTISNQWVYEFDNCEEESQLYKNSFLESIKRGLKRLSYVNIQLVSSIIQNELNHALTLSCKRSNPEKFSATTQRNKRRINIAQVLEKTKNLSRMQAAFFHEFLHVNWIDNQSVKKHNSMKLEDYLSDAVYACDAFAFPFLNAYLSNSDDLELAYSKACVACALVSKQSGKQKTFFKNDEISIEVANQACADIDSNYFD